MKPSQIRYLFGLGLVAVLLASPTMASKDIYLQTNPQIKGDVTGGGYDDQIQLLSFNHGGYNTACSGGKGGDPVLAEASFTKETDQATVDMLEALRDKTMYAATFFFTKDSGGHGPATTYNLYEFTNVVFTSYSMADTGNVTDPAIEVWTLSYSSLDVTYDVIDAGGQSTGTETMTFTPVACVN